MSSRWRFPIGAAFRWSVELVRKVGHHSVMPDVMSLNCSTEPPCLNRSWRISSEPDWSIDPGCAMDSVVVTGCAKQLSSQIFRKLPRSVVEAVRKLDIFSSALRGERLYSVRKTCDHLALAHLEVAVYIENATQWSCFTTLKLAYSSSASSVQWPAWRASKVEVSSVKMWRLVEGVVREDRLMRHIRALHAYCSRVMCSCTCAFCFTSCNMRRGIFWNSFWRVLVYGLPNECAQNVSTMRE